LRDPISKTPITKRTGRVAQGEGPEFKPPVPQKKIEVRCYDILLSALL
jgi:hypothetical protein